MNGTRIRAIARKEWLDLKKSKTVLISMALVPMILTGVFVAFVLLSRAGEMSARDLEELRRIVPPELSGMDPRDAMTVLLSQQFLLMMLITPLALPGTIAANSIVGEKVERSLEPLLATPITTTELILGKAMVSVLPTVALTWASWLVTVALVGAFGTPAVLLSLIAPRWVIAMALLAPLFASLSTLGAMIASSRTNDPKVAQSWSVVVILPLLGLGAASLIARVMIDITLLLWSAAALLLVVIGVLQIAVKVFARESILTRWK